MSKTDFIRKASKWLPKIKKWVDEHGGGQIIPMSCEFENQYFDLRENPEGQKSKFFVMRFIHMLIVGFLFL